MRWTTPSRRTTTPFARSACSAPRSPMLCWRAAASWRPHTRTRSSRRRARLLKLALSLPRLLLSPPARRRLLRSLVRPRRPRRARKLLNLNWPRKTLTNTEPDRRRESGPSWMRLSGPFSRFIVPAYRLPWRQENLAGGVGWELVASYRNQFVKHSGPGFDGQRRCTFHEDLSIIHTEY